MNTVDIKQHFTEIRNGEKLICFDTLMVERTYPTVVYFNYYPQNLWVLKTMYGISVDHGMTRQTKDGYNVFCMNNQFLNFSNLLSALTNIIENHEKHEKVLEELIERYSKID